MLRLLHIRVTQLNPWAQLKRARIAGKSTEHREKACRSFNFEFLRAFCGSSIFSSLPKRPKGVFGLHVGKKDHGCHEELEHIFYASQAQQLHNLIALCVQDYFITG